MPSVNPGLEVSFNLDFPNLKIMLAHLASCKAAFGCIVVVNFRHELKNWAVEKLYEKVVVYSGHERMYFFFFFLSRVEAGERIVETTHTHKAYYLESLSKISAIRSPWNATRPRPPTQLNFTILRCILQFNNSVFQLYNSFYKFYSFTI
jgi:hypothetical protein